MKQQNGTADSQKRAGGNKSRRSAQTETGEKERLRKSSVPTTYFDYNLMLVIIFLTCFGLDYAL